MLRRETFKKLISLVFILGLGFFFLAMAPRPFEGEKASDQSVDGVFSDISFAYTSEDFISFVSLLDRDFEDLGNFKDALQEEFLSKKNLELRFVVDSVLQEKDRIFVRLHWFRKSTTSSGVISKTKGKSQFIFRQTPQGLKLLYIRGNNPFF
ncbi:MAG: hypothetical protein JSW17_01195 [Candidatus Omnitrophota bacterium]|nr:MAG: hypothetical protein JSW17_01195 [Candidatus Omnitrophota bacterium]